eukprot:4202022-Pyramimonas_sp.AAC.1
MGAGAFDHKGAWHPGVAMHRTCKWEPRYDSTATAALNSALACATDIDRLSAFARRFIYVSSRSEAIRQAALRRRLGQRSMRNTETVKAYLNALDTQSFILPFYFYRRRRRRITAAPCISRSADVAYIWARAWPSYRNMSSPSRL